MKFEARSGERIAILLNTVTYSRSLQHTACDLYWESAIHEHWCRTPLQSVSIPKVPASCTHAEFAPWTSGSTESRCEKIHRPSKRTVCTGKPVAHFLRTHVGSIPEKVSDGGTGKPVAVTLSTEFHVFLTQPSKRRYESQGNRQKTDSTVRESPEPGLVKTGFQQNWRVGSVQWKGVDHRYGQYGNLRALRLFL